MMPPAQLVLVLTAATALAGCSSDAVDAPARSVTVPCSPEDTTACTDRLADLVDSSADTFDALKDPMEAQSGARQQVKDGWRFWSEDCQSGNQTLGDRSSDCQATMLKIAVGANRLEPDTGPL